jgi:hypothetical protein
MTALGQAKASVLLTVASAIVHPTPKAAIPLSAPLAAKCVYPPNFPSDRLLDPRRQKVRQVGNGIQHHVGDRR